MKAAAFCGGTTHNSEWSIFPISLLNEVISIMLQKDDLLSKSPVPLVADTDLVTNSVLRNTYMLLSLTLLFSAFIAGIAVVSNAPPLHWLVTLAGYFGLLFVVTRLRNSAWGLLAVFALTGFLGYTLGPMLGAYLRLPNGPQLVTTALAGTGAIFLALSGYALVSRKDFSFMGAFLMVGILVAFLASIGAVLFNLPMLSLAVSAMVILLMSGMILWQTSEIIHGGETNYIMATVTLYITIFNLFINLLQILGVMSSDD
jgi:modulator of FtsH protease